MYKIMTDNIPMNTTIDSSIPNTISYKTDIETLKNWAYLVGLPKDSGFDNMRKMYYIRIIKGYQPIPKPKKKFLIEKIVKENKIARKHIKNIKKSELLDNKVVLTKVAKIKIKNPKRKELILKAIEFGYSGNKKSITNNQLEEYIKEQTKKNKYNLLKPIFIRETKNFKTYKIENYNQDINTTDSTFINDINYSLTTLNLEPSQFFRISMQNNETGNRFGFKACQWRDFEYFEQEYKTNLESWRYEKFINSIDIFILKPQSGGCNVNNEKVLKIDGCKFISPKSSNNNCFFHCIKEELERQETTVTKTFCNKIRKELLNKPDNSPISVDDAQKIFQYLKITDVGIMSEKTKPTNSRKNLFIIYNSNDLTQDLSCGHWCIFTGQMHTCPLCGDIYLHKHSPSRCLEIRNFRSNITHNKKDRIIRKIPLYETEMNNTEVLHFDIETSTKIKGFEGQQIPICLGYEYFDDETNEWIYNAIVGDNIMDNFLMNHLIDLPLSVKYINSYNGSNFDNRFLMGAYIKRLDEINSENKKESFLLNNGSLIKAEINLELFGTKRKFNLIDLCKHTGCSLRSLLKDLKCDTLKGKIDYEKLDSWDNMTSEFQEEILKYLKDDVIGLRKAYCLMNMSLFDKYRVNMSNYLSTSHIAYEMWKETYLKTDYNIHLMDLKDSKFCREAVYGGRTYPNKKEYKSTQYDDILNGEFDFNKIDDFCVDLDANSLYPTAMSKNFYPVGKHFYTNRYQKDYLGIYECEVTCPKNILTPQLPRKENGLIWDLNDRKQVLTSVDIERAESYGYKINILKGIFWNRKAKIFEEYITDCYKTKEELKIKGLKNTPAYLLSKLTMNGLYGKMIQRPIIDQTELVKTTERLYSIFNKNIITDICEIPDTEYLYLTFHSKENTELDECVTKPAHLGAFILAYSRNIMSDFMKILNPNDTMEDLFYYTDTDSIQTHCSTAQRITLGNELGMLSNDLGETAKIIRGVWIAPKLYKLEYAELLTEKTLKQFSNLEDDETISCIYKGKEIVITNKTSLVVGSYIIRTHVRGKGVSSDQFENNKHWYDEMLHGKSIVVDATNNFKKLNFKLNSKQKGNFDMFSTICINGTKTLNSTSWWGRNFINLYTSFPHGFHGFISP